MASALRTAAWIGSGVCGLIAAGALLLRGATRNDGDPAFREGSLTEAPVGAAPADAQPLDGATDTSGPRPSPDGVAADPCASQAACREAGRCTDRDGACVAARPEHCQRSAECDRLGHCGLRGNLCLPTSPEHCKQSTTCREEGACLLVEDGWGVRCGALTHDDCGATDVCSRGRRCRIAPVGADGGARCIEAELVVQSQLPLTIARHGIRGELVLLVDGRLVPRGKPARRGLADHDPEGDEPRAASVVELRGADGNVRGVLTLFPSVSLSREDLGSGTDTFLATEGRRCPEGHWCGPLTTFIEVRGGELARVQAIGARGVERPLEASASSGSRWKLERRKKPRGADLVVQLEGLLPPGPALTETRYTFSKGRFRFTEKQFFAYLPTVAKQPGPWQGELRLHAEPHGGGH